MKNLFLSFQYAWRGLRFAYAKEQNFRIHFGASIIVIALGFYYKVSVVDWCVMSLAMGTVISAELINTSVEGLVDLVSPDRNPAAGRIKDIAAAAVLVATTAAI